MHGPLIIVPPNDSVGMCTVHTRQQWFKLVYFLLSSLSSILNTPTKMYTNASVSSTVIFVGSKRAFSTGLHDDQHVVPRASPGLYDAGGHEEAIKGMYAICKMIVVCV